MNASLKLYYANAFNAARAKALAGDERAARKAAFYARKLRPYVETVYPVCNTAGE